MSLKPTLWLLIAPDPEDAVEHVVKLLEERQSSAQAEYPDWTELTGPHSYIPGADPSYRRNMAPEG